MSLLLGFIIPLKPRKESMDWDNDVRLLQKTLRSVVNQTNSSFKVYVVYTDEPLQKTDHPRVKYIAYPFPFMEYDDVDAANPGEFLPSATRLVERRFDKGRKIMYGCRIAKEEGCKYLMNVDADDLVSNRIAAHIASHNEGGECAGWFIPKGYVWNEAENRLYRQSKMHLFNGSTHILSSKLLPIPEPDATHWQNFNWFVAHGWTRIRFQDKLGAALRPLPFYGVVYVVHPTNISGVMKSVSEKSIKGIIKRLFLRKRITSAIRAEFNLPANDKGATC